MTIQLWGRKGPDTVDEPQPEVNIHKFPLAQKINLLMAELRQCVEDLNYLHSCTGNEYADRRRHELQLRVEEISNL